jgi:hypothetical protein
VEHRQHAVGAGQIARLEQRVGRIRAARIDAALARASAGAITSISSRPR